MRGSQSALLLAALILLWQACGKTRAVNEAADELDGSFDDRQTVPADLVEPADSAGTAETTGAPCGDNPACTGVCAPGPHSDFCLQPCQGSCPEGTLCKTTATSSGSTAQACLPIAWELCRPCVKSSDCGLLDDRCILTDDLEAFCGLLCQESEECPNGFGCALVNAVDGGDPSHQCVPKSYQCGCLPHHSGSVGLCTETSKWGECRGGKACQVDGSWSDCSAPLPTEETCNGTDDNCDGFTDEGFPDDDLDGVADCMDSDPDGDGVLEEDNCPGAFNPGQDDWDQDSEGDICDPDDDNDGWPDFYDCQPQDDTSYPGAEELMDGVDNNCNGVADEALSHPVGNCGVGCFASGAGPGQEEPFDMDEDHTKGLAQDEKGYLKLSKAQIPMGSIWIANSWENSVSRLDTETGNEVGRYKVCSDPSRTAVDLDGNVWVACRGDGGVAKIRLYPLNCQDQDGDGEVLSSQDLDGNGVISAGEMMDGINQVDECLQFITYPGGSCQRAAGVDKDNHAWIGEWNGYGLRRLEPLQGQVVQTITVPDRPYGLIVDGDGVIWISGRGGGHLVRVVPETGVVEQLTPGTMWFEPYGISVDGAGRIWVASCFGENKVHRYNPADGTWASASVGSSPRGLVANTDGKVYVALDSASAVAVVDGESVSLLSTMSLGGGWKSPVGMSIDAQGYVWAVNQMGNSATKLDPVTGDVVGTYPVGNGPYTYSDMTGFQLYNYTAPMGVYTHTFQALPDVPAQWTEVAVEILFPPGATASMKLRASSSLEELESVPWQVEPQAMPDGPAILDLTQYPQLNGHYLQVQVTLFSGDDSASPLLKKLTAMYVTGYE